MSPRLTAVALAWVRTGVVGLLCLACTGCYSGRPRTDHGGAWESIPRREWASDLEPGQMVNVGTILRRHSGKVSAVTEETVSLIGDDAAEIDWDQVEWVQRWEAEAETSLSPGATAGIVAGSVLLGFALLLGAGAIAVLGSSPSIY